MSDHYLRRYTDVPALVYLLSERKITLLDPQSWDDSNENLQTVLALCFTQADETYHHWRIFTGGSGGVCIRFKRAALLKAIAKQPGVRIDTVDYLTLKKMVFAGGRFGLDRQAAHR